jgi:hypothetical protein
MAKSISKVARRSLIGPALGTLAALSLVSGGVWAATNANDPVDPTVTVTDVVTERAALAREATVTETATDVVKVVTDVVKVTETPTVKVTETDVVKVTPTPVVTVTDVTVVDKDIVEVQKPVTLPAPIHVEQDVQTVTVTG